MEPHTKSRLYALMPWVVTLVFMVSVTLYGVLYKSDFNPFKTPAN